MVKLNLISESLLKRTTSRCPVCHAACPAEVWRVSEGKQARVFLKKLCAEHGESVVCISSDARFYWLAQGDPQNANGGGCCGGKACSAGEGGIDGTLGRNAHVDFSATDGHGLDTDETTPCCGSDHDDASECEPENASAKSVFHPRSSVAEKSPNGSRFEKLSTCLALIEIVNSCNLACPVCYADSPIGAAGAKLDAVPLADLQRRIQGIIDRKGGIEILQLSGGEPTLHPQFFELLEWAHANPGIDYVLLNTNGVRIANDEAFAARLGETFRYGKMQLYLQFDGVQETGQRELRGGDFRALRERAIERCGAMNPPLPVTLAMTVTPENLPHLWEAITFGLRYRHVRGISFQPMFWSGRVAIAESGLRIAERKEAAAGAAATASEHASAAALPIRNPQFAFRNRLNTADIILAAVEQSGGKLRFEDFTPLPCGDPNCATIGYLLKTNDGETRSISDFINFAEVQGFLRDKIRYSLGDLSRCGCENEPLGELLHAFEMNETNTFRLFIKPFMDAWTWDEDRIDRCCTHVIRPDGKLDSFCRYYSSFEDARS